MNHIRSIRIGDRIKWVKYPTIFTIESINLENEVDQILWRYKNSFGDDTVTWSSKVDAINKGVLNSEIIIIRNISPDKVINKFSFI